MSPSANNLAKRLGRDLRQGDVLLWQHTLPRGIKTTRGIIAFTGIEVYEVVNPHVADKRKKLFGEKEVDCVEVRELIKHGTVAEQTHILIRRGDKTWNAVIRAENRTDRPSLKER